MGVAEFFEGDPKGYTVSGIDVESPNFSFSGGRHDVFENPGDVENRSVVCWGLV